MSSNDRSMHTPTTHNLNAPTTVFIPTNLNSAQKRLMGESLKFPVSKGKIVRGNPGLNAAVERDDFEDLIHKNAEYISRLIQGQGDTLDSLTDMVDALGGKINESSNSATNLVERLSALDSMIDEEKRKWIIQASEG